MSFFNKKENKENKVKEKKEKKLKNKEKTKEPKTKKVKDENKVKLKEKVSLNVRKKVLVDNVRTFLLIVILVLAYISLNLAIQAIDLPEIDVTESKVYTLSEDSKKALEKVNQDIKIYSYGFEEDSQLIKFLKQYNEANEKITYEILTEESNYEKVKENELKEGYYVLILESGDAKKVIDASTEFSTVDYTTYEEIDITEQTITNAVLGLLVENKPKAYFTTGHGEYALSEYLALFNSYLQNESFIVEEINLATVTSVPEDCDVLVMMSPMADLFDIERDIVLDYISKGGKIYYSTEPLPIGTEFPNIATVLSQFGVSVQNGQIIELTENYAVSSSPNIFQPQLSSSHEITSDIYSSNGKVWLAYSARLNFADENTLSSLNVTKEDLLTSTDQSIFITDLASDLETAMQTAQTGSSVVASILTKTIPASEGEENDKKAELVISASGSYIADYTVPVLSETYPLSYVENNKDFAINSLAYLTDKEGLTIRKKISSYSNYVPTDAETRIVYTMIFAIPGIIILIGIFIWMYRRKRK